MSQDVFGKSETEKLRMEMISAIVQRALRENAQLVPTISDVSALAQPGLDSISFPRRTSKFNVQNLVEDSEADVQSFEYDLDKLELNHHAMISWFIKKRSDLQAMVNIEADTIAEAAAEHGIDVDRKVQSAMLAGAASANNVAVTGAYTKDKFLEGRELLQKATKLNPQRANFFCLVNSKRERDLLNIGEFVKANEYGQGTPLITGELGRLFGVRVLLTDEEVLGDGNGLMYVQPGIVYGNQMTPDLNDLYIPRKAGTEYALDQLYGIKILDGGKYISKVTFS